MIHNVGDIFTLITRITVNADFRWIYKINSALVLLGVLIYTRLYIFGKIIYYIVITDNHGPNLFYFLLIINTLLLLHMNCVGFLSKKIYSEFRKSNYDNKLIFTYNSKSII